MCAGGPEEKLKYKYGYTLASRMGLSMYEEMAAPSTASPADKMAKQIPFVGEIKSLTDTTSFIQRLREVAPHLDEYTLAFLEKERVSGRNFLKITENDLSSRGLGPSKDISEIIDMIKNGELLVKANDLNVQYTSGTDSEVENVITGMDNLNVDSPSNQ